MTSGRVVYHRLSAGMRTTNDFLDGIMQKHGLTTDYQLHKLLGVTKQTIYRYRANRGSFDEDVAIRAANLLEIDPMYVLACVAGERTRHESARELWLKFAEKMKPAAVLAVVAFALMQFASGGTLDFSLLDQAALLPVALAGNTHYAHSVVALVAALLVAAAWSARRR